MFLDSLKENTDVFGVDVGASAVRVAKLKKSFGKYELEAFGSNVIKTNASLSDSSIEQESVAGSIRDLVHSANITTKKVVAALPGDAIFTTTINLPVMPVSEIGKAVEYQAEKDIPLKLSEARIDWQITGKSKDQIQVMIIAAPLTRINRMVKLFDMAKLELVVLESNSFAVARALQTNEPLYIILNIGSSASEITIVENGLVTFTRTLPVAGQAFTRAIMQGLNADANYAEQVKQKFGLQKGKLEGRIIKAMNPLLENLTDEIERSIKFYYEKHGKNITLLKLTGSSSKLLGLQDYLSDELGIGVIYGNPWNLVAHKSDISQQLNANALSFGTVVGLAMREF